MKCSKIHVHIYITSSVLESVSQKTSMKRKLATNVHNACIISAR